MSAHGYTTHGAQIPDDVADALDQYVEEGIVSSSFLISVLSDQLFNASARATETERAALVAIVFWLHHEAPSACHGNGEKVIRWIDAHARASR